MSIFGAYPFGHDLAQIGASIIAIRKQFRALGFSAEQVAWMERQDYGSQTTAEEVEESLRPFRVYGEA